MNAMNTNTNEIKRYVMLDEGIPYDNDDFYVWANVLYDTESKEVVVSYYGHGSGCKYTDDTCEDLSLVDREALCKSVAEKVKGYLEIHNLGMLYCKCSINGGRKLKKGDGYILVGYKEEYNSWASARSYSGGVYDLIAEVYDPSNEVVRNINPSYVTIDEPISELLWEALYNSELDLKQLAHLVAYKISYSHCDREKLSGLATECMQNYLKGREVEKSLTEAINIDDKAKEDRRKAKQEERLKNNLASIRQWAISKLPRTASQDEIEELVQKVIKKHYQ